MQTPREPGRDGGLVRYQQPRSLGAMASLTGPHAKPALDLISTSWFYDVCTGHPPGVRPSYTVLLWSGVSLMGVLPAQP